MGKRDPKCLKTRICQGLLEVSFLLGGFLMSSGLRLELYFSLALVFLTRAQLSSIFEYEGFFFALKHFISSYTMVGVLIFSLQTILFVYKD